MLRITLWVTLAIGASGCPGPEAPESPDAGTVDAGSVCGPLTCSGCCEANLCRIGNRETACGNSGVQCAGCGLDALCGPTKRCEPLDPNRFSSNLDGGKPSYDGGREQEHVPQTCATIGGQWICW